MQLVQDAEPAGADVPALQAPQVAEPAIELVPAAHCVHAPAPACEKVPAAHAAQALAPALALVPALHALHSALPPAEALPALHLSHTRSVTAEPLAMTPKPDAHDVHLVQLALLSVELKEPAAHAAHFRSSVAEPALLTYWPAPQLRLGTQGVAALASSSHLSAVHAVFGFVPPAQCVPASHAAQTGGLVGVPAFVCTVPA